MKVFLNSTNLEGLMATNSALSYSSQNIKYTLQLLLHAKFDRFKTTTFYKIENLIFDEKWTFDQMKKD